MVSENSRDNERGESLVRGHRRHRGEASQRMCFYRRQFREGNLQVLCTVCNAKKADEEPVLVLTAPISEEPF